MIESIRSKYTKTFPLAWRKAIWNAYWLLISLKADYIPKILFLNDYEKYWMSREENCIWELSYKELTTLCNREIRDYDRVLDFGCGAGFLLKDLLQRKDITGFGLDISERAVELARNNGINANVFHLEDPEGLIAFGHFNVAIATEVLEHIQQAEMVMIALSKVSDCVLVSIPNSGYYGYRLRYLFGRFPRQWIIHPGEHVRFWTLADFKFTANITGFEVMKVCSVNGGRLGRLWPSLFTSELFFVLKPSTNTEI